MPTRSTTTIGALLLIAPFPARGFCTTGSPVDTISIADMVLAVETAAAVSWSPDGRHLAYQLASPGGDASARGSIRVLEAFERGGRDLLVVPHLPRYTYPDVVPDLRWSPDGSRIVYATNDAYYTVPLLGGPPELLVRRPLFGSVTTLSPDQTRLAFIRDEALWTQSVLTGEAHLVAKQDVRLHSSQRLWWSPDSSLLAFLATTEDGVKVGIVSAGGGPVQWVVPVEDIWAQSFVSWAPDSRQMAIARLSGDLRRIELVIADLASGATSKIWEDRDERWVTHGYSESLFKAAWSRSGERLTFITDHEGYAHLYVTAVDSGHITRLTSGPFSVHWSTWSPDDAAIMFISDEDAPHERQIWLVSPDGGQARRLTEHPGIAVDYYAERSTTWMRPQWSPDGTRVAFSFSGPDDLPMLLISGVSGAAETRVVHSSRPADLDAADVPHMESLRFVGRDGTSVPAVMVTARDLDHTSTHPALIYMYGGWGQWALLGRGLGIKSSMFDYLANAGYVVLIVDPRGSEGYGDAHARGSYQNPGAQVDDLVAATDFLRSTGYVDPERIALFGHSYGAYLVVQAMVQAPERFAAGIAQAGVYDWLGFLSKEPSYGHYIRVHVGSPGSMSEHVRRFSPIHRISELAGALLVMHGTADHIPISESEELAMELMRHDKEFNFLVYPGEPHVLTRPETVRDFAQRVVGFLDANVGVW